MCVCVCMLCNEDGNIMLAGGIPIKHVYMGNEGNGIDTLTQVDRRQLLGKQLTILTILAAAVVIVDAVSVVVT